MRASSEGDFAALHRLHEMVGFVVRLVNLRFIPMGFSFTRLICK